MEEQEVVKEFTREELAAFMKQDLDKRLRRCLELIDRAQKETGCKLIGVPVITQDGRILANVQIVSADPE